MAVLRRVEGMEYAGLVPPMIMGLCLDLRYVGAVSEEMTGENH